MRRFDIGAVLMHLSIVVGFVAGAEILARQLLPALMTLAVAGGLFALGRSLPPPDAANAPDAPEPEPVDQVLRPPVPVHHVRPRQSSTMDDEPSIPRLPPLPAGRPVPGWAPPGRRVRVASTPRHLDALTRARRSTPGARAVLVSDVSSPHHPYAVAVYVGDEYVGDLDGDDLLDYGPALAALVPQGIDIGVEAFFTSHAVDLALPEPGALRPVNEVPRGVVLPHGSPLPVATAGEESPGSRLLARYGRPGEDVWLAVTLHRVPGSRTRPSRDVRVRLDGVDVGHLAPGDAADMTPLLDHLGDRSVVPVAAALLRGSSLHRVMTVSCIRAQDADEDWLRALA